MHTTKSEILALLKRSDGRTVDDLATHIGLAPMTVRQHLTALQRDRLVAAEEVRRQTAGRPHFSYRLTDEGHRHISQGYDRVVQLLIEQAGLLEPHEVAEVSPDGRRAHLFRKAASSLAQQRRGELAALPGAARVERVIEVLRSYGGFAEWHQSGDVFEIRDFNCVFRSNVPTGPCAWHETLLSELLGCSVSATVEDDGCSACCRYIVSVRA